MGDIVMIYSPNERLKVDFNITNDLGKLEYKVYYDKNILISKSYLGLKLNNDVDLTHDFEVIDVKRRENSETWKSVYGERSTIPDIYNETQFYLQQKNTKRKITIIFRIYNEGVAFKYKIHNDNNFNKIHIDKEITQFCFNDDYTTWSTYSAQGAYEETSISKIKPGCERPLIVRLNNNRYVALAEANLVDFSRMKFKLNDNEHYCIESHLDGQVISGLPLTTPWRVIMIADTPGQLLENNHMILNLNEPCKIKDTSFIKPGKVLREVTLTTQGGKACVDFAAKHNLQYVQFDAGWYGCEYDDNSDAAFVSVDTNRSKGPLDLKEIIQYADSKGIGIILYVNRRALEKQFDKLLPIYKEWGIKGIKFGFVNVGSQYWTDWLHKCVRKAAEYEFLVDIHDEYRPTGYSRTYPNLMTQEGIRGDEELQSTENTLTVLFSRMIAGAGDHTVCYFDPRVDKLWSHAYQLAKSVVFYSPLQFLYWYDRPEGSPYTDGAGGKSPFISEEPELEFFDSIPTVWEETKVLNGEIGKYATIARKSKNQWFLGSMNSKEKRQFEISLNFLDKDIDYTAYIYYDDMSLNTRTKVAIQKKIVTSDMMLSISMIENGGYAARFVPLNK